MSTKRRYIDIPDRARRDFIKWTIGVGAALGLRPWKVMEVTESVIGPAAAQSAAKSPVTRLVMNHMGSGGLAWMTQLFPFTNQATQAGRAFYKTGQAKDQQVEAGDHPMKLSPDAPDWKSKARMTGFLCGVNETHTNVPVSALKVGSGVSVVAAAAAIQTASPTLVPAICLDSLFYGNAVGAPAVATVGSAAGMVKLFSSKASEAGAALSNPRDKALFEAYYKANVSLHRAAQHSTSRRGFLTGKVASNLIGQNFGKAIEPTNQELVTYGVDGLAGTAYPGNDAMVDTAKALITTVKLFQNRLTSMVVLPGPRDDPHFVFADMATMEDRIKRLGKMWTAFWADLAKVDDPFSAGDKLADNTVIAWSGDTYKTPNQTVTDDLPGGNWDDATPGASNILYVLGAGYLRSGWFGQVLGGQGPAGGEIETWDPATGANIRGGETGPLAAPATAALLYAISKGDMQRVRDFYRGGSIDGVVKKR